MATPAAARSFRAVSIPAALGFGLRARYTPVENVPTMNDSRFLVDRFSPKRAAAADYYARLPRGRLSWCVISNVSTKVVGKAVVRNRLKRRWASAFAEALTKNGYYHNGRKRSGPNTGKNYEVGLKGTLEIMIFSDRGVSCPHRELVGASGALVKALIRKIERMNAEEGSEPQDVPAAETAGDTPSSLWSLWHKLL